MRLPSSLELLQVYIPVDLDRRGRIRLRETKIIDSLKADLAACRGGSNLVVKVETVPTSLKTADELFEEIADRYSLLR
ncbi:hypothetical protein BMF94_1550 [Rhodotorula taiwanensis]|uniref:Uncharacterized protein n=1 Tax=Rhodotorula taiwanensis TaxID=741276 RepID=A0A2S5BF69_9BASI|nr:hypothetical protein BMF94_1550 [Rhodotorula taiwanensis]